MTTATKDQYIYAIGRRKTSTAQIRVYKASALKIVVNGKDFTEYFPTELLQRLIQEPFSKGKVAPEYKITVLVHGGGIHGQAEAVRHGLSRALIIDQPETRVELKSLGLLKRDPRKKERKKFGFVKARKRVQWSKR